MKPSFLLSTPQLMTSFCKTVMRSLHDDRCEQCNHMLAQMDGTTPEAADSRLKVSIVKYSPGRGALSD